MKKQRGAALMAMLAVLILGAAWWTVTAISKPINRTAEDRAHNAKVLAEAKAALLGWIAMTAANAGENNPGRLPCPETPGQIGTAQEGVAAPTVGFPTCNAAPGTLIGRLPWRTLGIDQLRDATNEPLWYVVTTGSWALQNSGASTTINSNSVGQLTVDGQANAAIALIIAPGGPLSVQASANCLARNQTRTTPGPTIDFRDYLECQNATSPADVTFATAGPSGSFNDQVLAVTVNDVLPVIEAAVADRFERNVAPVFRNLYSGPKPFPDGSWPATPVLPFAVSIAPTFPDPATSSFKGGFGTNDGLLPLSLSETSPSSGIACTVAAQGPRCDPAFVSWTGAALAGGGLNSASCTTTPTQVDCVFYRKCLLLCGAGNMPFTLTATAANVGMALRQLNNAAAMTNVNPAPRSSSGVLNNNGSATITLNAEAAVSGGVGFGGVLGDLLCGVLALLQVCKQETISVPIGLLADHPVLDPANAMFSWFFRNNWHQVSYYAVAPDIAPSGPRACGANCLTVNFRNPSVGQRGLIVIAGRSLAGQARPPIALTDWLEEANSDGNLVYATRAPTLMINRTFNDRIAVIDP